MVGDAVADIGRRDVRDWFASLRATPVAADRSMPVLPVIMREAEATLGCRDWNDRRRGCSTHAQTIRALHWPISTIPTEVKALRLSP